MTSVNKISDFKLERYLLGELSEKEMRELQERELSDEIFAARVAEMRLQGKRFVAENPFVDLEAKMATAEQSANDEHNVVSVMWLKVAAALVIALGVFSMVLLNRNVETFDSKDAAMQVAMADVDDGARIKGMQVSLEVWKKTGDSAVQMVNLGDAHEGDEIQLRYRVPQKCFGMLFSMDGNGTITMHMGEGNKAIELEPGKMTTLPFAYKLDNAPKFEKFFLLTSQNSFEIDGNDIDKSLKQTGVENVSFTLRKVGK